MGVCSEAFVDSIVGATGAPFVPGNRIHRAEQWRRVLPRDARRHPRGTAVGDDRGVYLLGGGDRPRVCAGARGAREFGRVGQDPARRGRSSTIGNEILTTLEGWLPAGLVPPDPLVTIGRFNHRTHRKSLVVDGRTGFTGGAGIADHWSGHAQDQDHWRDMQVRIEGRRRAAADRVHDELARDNGRTAVGPGVFPPRLRVGDVPLQTIMSSPSIGSSAARTLDLLSIVSARRSISIANPYFVPDPRPSTP